MQFSQKLIDDISKYVYRMNRKNKAVDTNMIIRKFSKYDEANVRKSLEILFMDGNTDSALLYGERINDTASNTDFRNISLSFFASDNIQQFRKEIINDVIKSYIFPTVCTILGFILGRL